MVPRALIAAFGPGIVQKIRSMVPSGPPVKINMVSVERNAAQWGTYVFPQKMILTAAELQTLNPNFQEEDPAWFRSRGAVDPTWSNIKLVVEGNRTNPVEITGLGCRSSRAASLHLTELFSTRRRRERKIRSESGLT